VAVQEFTFLAFGLYRPYRRTRFRRQLEQFLKASLLNFVLLLSWLFVIHENNYSRQMLFFFFILSVGLLAAKRIVLWMVLRHYRSKGYNLKHVVIVGKGKLAAEYMQKIREAKELGYHAYGYLASEPDPVMEDLQWLCDYSQLESVLEKKKPDEVISAVETDDFDCTPQIIAACEKTGCKLSIIPFYADYMSAQPQFDDLEGIPLLNIRRIPLDNLANAFVKRTMDIIGSALILIIFSPLMLFCAIGVKLSSPGPIIFRQERVGRNKKTFNMYKFRSMRVNTEQDIAWSKKTDSRKTKFGSFIRKYSLDEFPQFWNVLKGDMSLVGPRPEIPFYVDKFKDEVPRYMLKHLVRPGITGWAQVNGLRGDTSIVKRIRYDIYYIENWSLLFDLKILFLTVFGGKFKNDEQ
jgi:Undecaprenyl-phosphate glucose phosphotransferase